MTAERDSVAVGFSRIKSVVRGLENKWGSRNSFLVERRTRHRKVASSNPGRSGGNCVVSRVIFCVLTLIRCPFHFRVTAVVRKTLSSFCQKCIWQVTAKHAYTLDQAMSVWADFGAVQA